MGARVIVVEDEELIALFVRETLELAGYSVVSFAEGEAGSRYLQAKPAACAIIDVGLPDLPGDELARSIRRSMPELPVILSTGYSAADLEKSFAGDHPWVRVLSKPYNETRLLLEVERCLQLASSHLQGEVLSVTAAAQGRLVQGEKFQRLAAL